VCGAGRRRPGTARATADVLAALGAWVAEDLRNPDGLARPFLRRAAQTIRARRLSALPDDTRVIEDAEFVEIQGRAALVRGDWRETGGGEVGRGDAGGQQQASDGKSVGCDTGLLPLRTGAPLQRVAVPTDGAGGLTAPRCGHFGHCSCFTIVEVDAGEIGAVSVVDNVPHRDGGCMTPVLLLSHHRVDAIVVDGIGGRPLAGFGEVGIAVHSGVGETVEQAVRAYAAGQLPQVAPGGTCRH